MIYIKRLIQRKQIKPLLGILFVFLIGTFCLFTVLFDFMQEKSYYAGAYLYALPNMTRIFTYSAIGRILLGSYIIYLSIWNLPKWTIHSQNKEDYHVTLSETHVDIQFQKWNWNLERENISADSFFFFDKTHKFVPPARGFQVFNALAAFFPEAIGKSLSTGNDESSKESICQFQHTRKATPEETRIFLKQTGKTCFHLFGKIFSLTLIIGSLSFFSYAKKDMGILLVLLWLFIFALVFCGVQLFRFFDSDRKTARWIQDHGMFVAKGYPYAKNTSHTDEGFHYSVKIWDGRETYLPKWFSVDKKIYDLPETVPLSIYYYKDKNGIYQAEMITENDFFYK